MNSISSSHTLKHTYVQTFYRIFMGFSIFYSSLLPCKTNILIHGVFSWQHTFRNIYLYFHFSQLVWPFLGQQAPGLYLSHHSHYNWPKGNEWSSFMLPFWCLAACSGHVVFRPNWFFQVSGCVGCGLSDVWKVFITGLEASFVHFHTRTGFTQLTTKANELVSDVIMMSGSFPRVNGVHCSSCSSVR